MTTQVKKSKDLTLKDRLSRLTFTQACELLGGPIEGKKLLYAGGKIAIEDLKEQVYLDGDLFRLSLPDEGVIVTITMRQDQVKRTLLNCDTCDVPCHHLGAALSLILDSKSSLGLAKPLGGGCVSRTLLQPSVTREPHGAANENVALTIDLAFSPQLRAGANASFR